MLIPKLTAPSDFARPTQLAKLLEEIDKELAKKKDSGLTMDDEKVVITIHKEISETLMKNAAKEYCEQGWAQVEFNASSTSTSKNTAVSANTTSSTKVEITFYFPTMAPVVEKK